MSGYPKGAVVALTLLAFVAASFGVVPTPRWLDSVLGAVAARLAEPERFPCEGCSCACAGASECWSHCCCHTEEQRVAWAIENGVTPPSGLRGSLLALFAKRKSEAERRDLAAPAVAVRSSEAPRLPPCCAAREHAALAAASAPVAAADCCDRSGADSATAAAANAGQCCAAEDAAHAGASRTILGPCMSPLGCKGASALTLVIPPPMLLPAAIPALVLTWSRIDRVVIVGMHAHSRALDVTAPPPRAR